MNKLQRYRVKAIDGQEHTGYIHCQVPGVLIVEVYKNVSARLNPHSPAARPYASEKLDPTEWPICHDALLAVVVNPIHIIPVGKPTRQEELSFTMVKQGTWWQQVKVQYRVISENEEDSL